MAENPYESPKDASGPTAPARNIFGLRKKPWLGYFVAMFVGAFIGATLLLPATAAFDDAGGTQMLIGGFLGLVIYGLLF